MNTSGVSGRVGALGGSLQLLVAHFEDLQKPKGRFHFQGHRYLLLFDQCFASKLVTLFRGDFFWARDFGFGLVFGRIFNRTRYERFGIRGIDPVGSRRGGIRRRCITKHQNHGQSDYRAEHCTREVLPELEHLRSIGQPELEL